MKNIIKIALMAFVFAFVACSGDGNPAAGRIASDSSKNAFTNGNKESYEAMEEAAKKAEKKGGNIDLDDLEDIDWEDFDF